MTDPKERPAALAAGATTESRRIQEGSPAYVLPYLSDPRLPFPRDPGKPACVEEVRTDRTTCPSADPVSCGSSVLAGAAACDAGSARLFASAVRPRSLRA